MSDVTQTFSQLLYTYGPGAMLDLPDHAVVVAGLEGWDVGGDASKVINEPRLTDLLRRQLPDRVPPNVILRTPPQHDDRTYKPVAPGVAVRIFPTWFVCDPVSGQHGSEGEQIDVEIGRGETRRRMVEWRNLSVKNERLRHEIDGKKVDVSPVRFVAACTKGHLQDIDWRFIVHRGGDASCRRPMWWIERGVSSDPADISVRCECNARVVLSDLYKPGFLGTCGGRSPWLDTTARELCSEEQRLLSRSATNTYFAQSVRVISLPLTDDVLTRAVEAEWPTIETFLASGMATSNVVSMLKMHPSSKERFTTVTDDEVADAIDRHGKVIANANEVDPRVLEFDRLASGEDEIGSDDPGSLLYARTMPRCALDLGGFADELVAGVVAVDRLREVSCLYGFTRLEPAPTAAESELDEIRLAVEGARLSIEAHWLPAIEQFGEGVFLHFDPAKIDLWRRQAAVEDYASHLVAGEVADAKRWKRIPHHPGIAYWAIHSLSHAIMIEVALECGYPLSSLKERIYASSKPPHRFGLLLYTATAGGQGTLGGLSAMAIRVPTLLERSIERLALCSNDPVCGDHMPDTAHDERHLQGAACHACLLVPETSCEVRNSRLDRTLVTPTLRSNSVSLISQTQ